MLSAYLQYICQVLLRHDSPTCITPKLTCSPFQKLSEKVIVGKYQCFEQVSSHSATDDETVFPGSRLL